MNSYGNIADAAKYPPTPHPGAYIGTIHRSDTPFPMKSTTEKKWKHFRDGPKWTETLMASQDSVSTAGLRRIAGLGVHITEVYSDWRCFLKGFFNVIDSFRYGRDFDGWRLLCMFYTGRYFLIR